MKKIIITSAVFSALLTNTYAENNITTEENTQNNAVVVTDIVADNTSNSVEIDASNLDSSINTVLIDTKIEKAKAIIEAEAKTITQAEAKAIIEAEERAVAKAEKIKAKAIAEAEATKVKIIAKAIKTKTIAEAEAVKVQTIAQIEARAIAETKVTKTKAESAKAKAIANSEATKIKAELIYRQATNILEEKPVVEITESMDSSDVVDNVAIVVDLSAEENIKRLLKKRKIEFRSGRNTLTRQGKNTVSKLADILKQYPEISIEIAGHTDSDGSEELNQKLSQARVDAVKEILVVQGINTDRLVAKGYGETKPLVPNTSKRNKRKNRRVEILIIQK